MHERSKKQDTTKFRLREYYHRVGIVQVTDSTSRYQTWIYFEERTNDLHMACPILDLVKNEAPKSNNSAVQRIDDNQPTGLRTTSKRLSSAP